MDPDPEQWVYRDRDGSGITGVPIISLDKLEPLEGPYLCLKELKLKFFYFVQWKWDLIDFFQVPQYLYRYCLFRDGFTILERKFFGDFFCLCLKLED